MSGLQNRDTEIFLKTSKSRGFTILVMKNGTSVHGRKKYNVEAVNGIPASITFAGFIHSILDDTLIWPDLCDLLDQDPFMCVYRLNLTSCIA